MMLSNAVNIAAANLLHCVKHCAAGRPIGISRKELSSICFDSSFCRIERIMFPILSSLCFQLPFYLEELWCI